jgi:hypothetical protein
MYKVPVGGKIAKSDAIDEATHAFHYFSTQQIRAVLTFSSSLSITITFR